LTLRHTQKVAHTQTDDFSRKLNKRSDATIGFPAVAKQTMLLLERAIVRSVLTIADVADFLPLQRVDQPFHRCVLRGTICGLTINDRGARNPDSYSLFAFLALRQGSRPTQYGPNGYVKEPSGRSPDGSFSQLPVR
jgi:hypothetical protein